MITRTRTRARTTASKSPYFPKPKPSPAPKKPKIKLASALRFPPTTAHTFGLIQESLSHDPFRLLIATIFLNKTRGVVAIPVLKRVFEAFPTVDALADADVSELTDMIRCLGFQNQRARRCVEVARAWREREPCRGRRYAALHYPCKGDGVGIGKGSWVGDEDDEDEDEGEGEEDGNGRVIVGWEIAHLPGLGAYALDSWRIFCRDELRGYNAGTGPTDAEFEPEWKRVRPRDKELRAYLTWMWLREGWVWNPETGERVRANNRMRRAGRRGGVLVCGEGGKWMIERVQTPS